MSSTARNTQHLRLDAFFAFICCFVIELIAGKRHGYVFVLETKTTISSCRYVLDIPVGRLWFN